MSLNIYERNDITLRQVDAYLDELRDAGEVNMFEAAEHLAVEFLLRPVDAYEMVATWKASHSY